MILVGVVGPWQAITAAAALNCTECGPDCQKNDMHVLIYGLSQRSIDITCRIIAETLPIAWIWVVPELIRKGRSVQRWQNAAMVKAIAGIPRTSVVEEIWTSRLDATPERTLFEAFHGARIRLFEDGLSSISLWPGGAAWRKQRLFDVGSRRDFLRDPRSRLFAGECINRRHAARVADAHFFLPCWLGSLPDYGFPVHKIAVPQLTASIASAATGLHQEDLTDFVHAKGRRAIILGTNTGGEHPADASAVIEFVKNRGYSVYWKGHPNLPISLAQPIGTQDGIIPNHIPVETIISISRPDVLVGWDSSSLLYGPALHNVPSYSVEADLFPRVPGSIIPFPLPVAALPRADEDDLA